MTIRNLVPQPRVRRGVRSLALFAVGLVLSGCGLFIKGESSTDSDCVSEYHVLADAPTWRALREDLLGDSPYGRVAWVRTQAKGVVGEAGRADAVRVVDLLSARDRRIVQADVWRTSTGNLRAGVWKQCID